MARVITYTKRAGENPTRRFGPIRETVSSTGDFRDTLRGRWAELPPQTERGSFIMGHLIKTVAASAPTLVAVPDEVAVELEELFAYLTENPAEVALAGFDSIDEKQAFVKQAKTWVLTRDQGSLEFRQLPSTQLGETDLKFTIRVPKTAEEVAAAALAREARKAKADANAAAGIKGPGRPRKVDA